MRDDILNLYSRRNDVDFAGIKEKVKIFCRNNNGLVRRCSAVIVKVSIDIGYISIMM